MNDKRIALVSGANRGLGLAIAKGLSQAGIHVLVGCRNVEAARETLASFEDDNLELVELEVKSEKNIEELENFIEKKFGRLDILVNNAGLSADLDAALTTWERYQRTFDVNVLGVTLLTEGMLSLLRQSDQPRVVNVSSSLASFGLRNDPSWAYSSFRLPLYQASKAALNSLTLSQASALAEYGIKVNAVCPGMTATEATQFQGRNVDESARIVIQFALIDQDGPTGSFVDDQGVVPW